MAGNDVTASLIETIVNTHHSPYVAIPPEEPRLVRPNDPAFPLIRSVANVKANGNPLPEATLTYKFPSSRESGIHYLERVWMEFPVSYAPGYEPGFYTPAALRAITSVELRTDEGVVIETLTTRQIDIWTRCNVPTTQLRILGRLSNGSGRRTLQLSLPLCIIKDSAPFPLASLVNSRLEIRVKFAPASQIDPTIELRGADVWLQGITLPQNEVPLLESSAWTLPITTLKEQTKLYELGNIGTLEAFQLQDARDLQEVYFVFRKPLEANPVDYLPFTTPVVNALHSCWLELGTEKLSHPLIPEIVRTVAFIGRHARFPLPDEGIHCIPISNATQPGLLGYSAPGLLTHAHTKISIRFRFNKITIPIGERDNFEITAVLVRRQLLSIRDGSIDYLDDTQGIPDGGVFDHDNEINPVSHTPEAFGSIEDDDSVKHRHINDNVVANVSDQIPEVLGYFTTSSKHEPFSRITQSVSLRGSHRFGETIVAVLPTTTDLVGALTLRLTLPSLPSSLRWINGVGYYLLSRVTVRHEDAILFDAPGEAFLLLDQQDDDPSVRTRRDATEKGYWTPGSINFPAPLKGSPDGTLQIPIPWSFGAPGFAPLPTVAFRERSLRVEIQLAPLEQLVVNATDFPINPLDPLPPAPTPSVECPPYERHDLKAILSQLGEEPVITATVMDIVGYMLPTQLREKLLERPQMIMTRQLKAYRFEDTTGMLRVLPISHALRRILYVSPRTSQSTGGERAYDPITLTQIYAGSTGWYQRIPPEEFFAEWTRFGTSDNGVGCEVSTAGDSDQSLYSIDFRPGFVNASRFDELRLQTTPGRMFAVTETTEPYRIQEGKIGRLFMD